KKQKKEKRFQMAEERAKTQDIRPLNIVILNLMQEKEKTELQLLRLLGNTPLQVNVTFLNMATHVSKNVSASHLYTFYSTFEDIKDLRFDGMIVTGAPIEHLKFEDVNYWEELVEIMEWSKNQLHLYLIFVGELKQLYITTIELKNMNYQKSFQVFISIV